jgi:hypothetical protein
MAEKRRLVGQFGAVFVPNCDEDTIAARLASGEWSEVEEPKKRRGRPPAHAEPEPEPDVFGE